MEKLYTKKQVIDMLNEHAEFNDYYPNVSSILENYTPIQLPTDEEMEKIAKEKHIGLSYRRCFLQGAKWMRDKIKGGKDERDRSIPE